MVKAPTRAAAGWIGRLLSASGRRTLISWPQHVLTTPEYDLFERQHLIWLLLRAKEGWPFEEPGG